MELAALREGTDRLRESLEILEPERMGELEREMTPRIRLLG